MDIERVKAYLASLTSESAPTSAPSAMADALLWIIDKFQEVPSVQVLQLGPEDVLVATFDRLVSDAEVARYRHQLEAQWPDNKVILVEGLALSVVHGE